MDFEISKCGKVRTPRDEHFAGNVSKTIVFYCFAQISVKNNLRTILGTRIQRWFVCAEEEEDNRQQQQHQSLQ